MNSTTLPAIRLRCRDCGDCWQWLGAKVHQRHPVITIQGVQHYVRRLVWQLKHGKPVPPKMRITASCDNTDCVNPEHVVARSGRQIAKRTAADGAFSTHAFRAKVALGKRRNSKLSDADVQRVRASTGDVAPLADELGISKAYAYMLRSGRFRVDYSNPFAQLFTP